MIKGLRVSQETHKIINLLKFEKGFNSIDETIKHLLQNQKH